MKFKVANKNISKYLATFINKALIITRMAVIFLIRLFTFEIGSEFYLSCILIY